MKSKALGAELLHLLSQGLDLDHFVLFSSLISLTGALGQASYVSANTYLDGLARVRRAMGLPAVSINWGPWQYVGMSKGISDGNERRGVLGLEVKKAFDALGIILESDLAQVGVYAIRESNLQNLAKIHREAYRHLTDLLGLQVSSPAEELVIPSESHLTYSGDESEDSVRWQIYQDISELLGIPADKLDVEAGFVAIGMDSIRAIELKSKLETRFGLSLSATLIYQYSTPSELADHIQVKWLEGRNGIPSVKQTPSDIADLMEKISSEYKNSAG